MNNTRYLARVIMEATTPIAVSSGEKDIIAKKLIIRDINGLPYIPGTSIAGVLRGLCSQELAKFFGFSSSKENRGSDVIISSAFPFNENGSVIEGLLSDDTNEYINRLRTLPVRQHVRIGANGAAVNTGLFDEEIVYKGARFCFEIEMRNGNKESFNDLLKLLHSPLFRLGGGTRSGYGNVKVVECKECEVEFCSDNYIDKTSSLNDKFWKKEFITNFEFNTDDVEKPFREIKIAPENFFSIEEYPLLESTIEWSAENKPRFSSKKFAVIPGSSIKGALAHRTAFYYNKNTKVFLDDVSDPLSHIDSNNSAIKNLFGDTDKRGCVIIDDVLLELSTEQFFVQPRIAIDAYAGGTLNSALLQKIQVHKDDINGNIEFNLYLDSNTIDAQYSSALSSAIDDLENGMLSIGSNSSIGLGIMKKCK